MNTIKASFLTQLILVSTAVASAEAAVTEISCNFSNGIPADWQLIDADGNTLSKDVQKFGFRQGDAWVPFLIEEENNAVASSTSWYSPSGTSSDWMILPALDVLPGATISWRSKAADRRFRDGLAVYVSTSASTPDEFLKQQPLFSVAGEENAWASHSISLKEFEGKSVRIAFVNNSNNKSRLFVDDIVAGIASGLAFESEMPYLMQLGTDAMVTGYVVNRTKEPMHGYTISLKADGKEFSKDFSDTLAPGERVKAEWKSDYHPARSGETECQITVTAGSENANLSHTYRVAPRKVFLEEGTGSWCGWCIKGIVAFQEAYREYPDNFIGIAIHSNDVMQTENYSVQDVMTAKGLPAGIVNRKKPIDPNPSMVLESVREVLASPMNGAIEAGTSYDKDTNKVTIDAKAWLNTFVSNGDYRICALAMEDDVHHDAPGYDQSNAYSGGAEGKMGGFESKPHPIPAADMVFPHVARAALTDVHGEKGSIPASLGIGETAEWHGEFTLPSTIDNIDKVKIILALLDGTSGEVLNAEALPVNCEVGVEDLNEEDALGIRINGNNVYCPGATHIEIYSIDGILLATGTNSASVPAGGTVIVIVRSAKSVRSYKCCIM